MNGLIILVEVTLPYVVGGVAISIVSALIVNYFSKEVENDKKTT